MKFHYTYQTKNLINGKTYIGVHSTNNLNDGYIGSGINLKKAIKKYGIENFKTEILAFFDTKEEAYEEEKFLIDENWIKSSSNYNLSIGGCGGNTLYGKTEEELKLIRQKLSLSKTGSKTSKEVCEKLSKLRIGEGSATFKNKKDKTLPVYITFNDRYKDRKYLLTYKRKLIGRFETLEEAIIIKKSNNI
jgi:hypothetical protein